MTSEILQKLNLEKNALEDDGVLEDQDQADLRRINILTYAWK